MLLDGKKTAIKILNNLKRELKKLPPIRLAVILVGNNPASLNFIKQKENKAKKIGANFKLYKFSSKINNQNLAKEIKKIIKNPLNTGIIIQLPLPSHLNAEKLINMIPAKKDVDALSVDNSFVKQPTPSGIIELLKRYKIKIKNKNIVIIGRGKLVGKPLAKMMAKAGGKITVCHSQTQDLKSETIKADILISATGQAHLVQSDMVKKGGVVIDAGFAKIKTQDKKEKITGDVDFQGVEKKVKYITPVPGGVGPMTVAMLMYNLVKLAKLQKSNK